MGGVDAGERARTALAAARAGGAVALDQYRTDLSVEQKTGKTDVVTRADREAEAAAIARIREASPDDPVVAEESTDATTVPESGRAWVVDPVDGTVNFVRGIGLWATAVAAVEDGEAVAAAVVAPALGDVYVADGTETRRVDWSAVAGGVESDENGHGAGASVPPVGALGERVTVNDRADPEEMAVAPTVWWDLDRREEYAAAASGIVREFGDLVRFRSAQLTLGLIAGGSLDATFTNRTPHPWDSVAGAHLVDRAGGTVTDVHGDPWRHDAAGLVASNGHRHEEVRAVAQSVAAVAEDSG